VYERPKVVLFNSKGEALEYWRHSVDPAPVEWDDDGRYELVVGADQGFVWYFKPEHFGKPGNNGDIPPAGNGWFG
jgi:hypothetical protein